MKKQYKKTQQGGENKNLDIMKSVPSTEQGLLSSIQIHSPLLILISTIGISCITFRWLWFLIAFIGAIISSICWLFFSKSIKNYGFSSNPDLPHGFGGLIYLFPAFMVGYAPASLLELINEDNDPISSDIIIRAILGGVFYAILFYASIIYYDNFIDKNKKMGVSITRLAFIIGGSFIGVIIHSIIDSDLYDAFYFSRGDGKSNKCYIKVPSSEDE